MKIEKISVSQINPAPYNPRVDLTPEDPAYQELEKSMTNLGYVDPIIWNCQTGNLVGGHQRFKILVNQGLTEIDVSVVDLSLEKEKALNIALNKIKGIWDCPKLANILQNFGQVPDFDFESIGFTAPDLSNILDNYLPEKEESFDVDQELERIETPITKPGDLLVLNNHRILCGDSLDPKNVERLLGDQKAQLVYIDLPYDCGYIPGNRPKKKWKKRKLKTEFKIANDTLSQSDYEKFMETILSNVKKFMDEGCPLYCWNGFRQFSAMSGILMELGFVLSNIITWVKPTAAISYSDYNFQSEFCLYAWLKGNGPHRWYGSTKESNVWEVNREKLSEGFHPTVKPVELAERAIKNSSQRGDIVFDPMIGSGGDLIACEKLGRRCYAIELSPRYVDLCVFRLGQYIGLDNLPKDIRNKYFKEVPDGK